MSGNAWEKVCSVVDSLRDEIETLASAANEVVVYSSVMDGLGTPTSDLDIYALHGAADRDERRGRPGAVAGEVAPQERLDVEWWEADDVARICDAARNGRARLDDLKVLHRLQTGMLLKGPACGGVKSQVSGIELWQPVIACLNLLVDDEARGCEGFTATGHWKPALLAARRAVTYATMAWCAGQGRLLFKEKWLMMVLERSWPTMAERYWAVMSLACEPDVPPMLDFVSRLKSEFDAPNIS